MPLEYSVVNNYWLV